MADQNVGSVQVGNTQANTSPQNQQIQQTPAPINNPTQNPNTNIAQPMTPQQNIPNQPAQQTPPSTQTSQPQPQTVAPQQNIQNPDTVAQPIATQGVTQGSNANDPLLTDKTYPDDLDSRWTSWKCLVCNYVYEGQKPINQCPRCGNSDPDKFD